MNSKWVNVLINDKPVEAYLSTPDGQGPHPGIVVAMHVFGIDKFVQGKCDALAEEGYIAIAPYLFHRSGISNNQLISYKFEDPMRREIAMPLKDKLIDCEIIDDMLAALDYLKKMDTSGSSFGVTGFCIGGRIAILMGVHSTEFVACADFYGVDMPTKKELLAYNKNNQEMCKYINAKSLKFLSLDGLYMALLGEKRMANYPQFSDHYFTGDYPIKPSDNLKGLQIKQLSLLSGKSNN